MITKGTLLFGSSDDSEYSIEAARKHIENEGFTADQVKIVNRDGQILVVAKIDFNI